MTTKQIILVSALLVISIAIYLFSRQPPPTVQVYTVQLGHVESSVSNTRSGTIEACKRSKLSPSIGGQIAAIYVKEGSQVKAGDLLMELWNQDLVAASERAESALQANRLQQHSLCISAASDERDAQRLSVLAEKELAADDIVDRAISKAGASDAICLAAKSQQKEYEAQLKVQQAVLEKTYIRAPFSGIVAQITGEVGEYTTPSPPGVPTPPAIDLLTSDCFYLIAPIDEVDAGLLHAGQNARVSLDAFRGQSFDGVVRRIAPYVEDYAKQARTVEIEVDFQFNERQLLAGYSADVEVILASKALVLRVPTEAIMENNKVWVVNSDSVIEAVTITPGIGNWKFTEVSAGLTQGQRVVTSLGSGQLAPGVEVAVENESLVAE